MMGYWGYGYGPVIGWGIFSGVIMLIIWILIIALIVAIIRRILCRSHGDYRNGFGRGGSRRRSFDILEERYARGEIDKAEFEEKKKDLMQ